MTTISAFASPVLYIIASGAEGFDLSGSIGYRWLGTEAES